MENKPTKIIWHHTAVSSNSDQFEGINNSHEKRHFPKSSLGFFIGYHYVIEHSGEVRQARLDTEIGAHVKGVNVGSIGIGLSGNFNTNIPSAVQKKAARKLVRQLMFRWQILPEQIRPHREYANTDCPGKILGDDWIIPNYLTRLLAFLIRILQNILSGSRKK